MQISGRRDIQEEGTACAGLTGGWRDDVGRVPPGQPSHSGPWRFGDLCSVTGGAQWDPVFWAVRAPSRADRTQRRESDVLISQGKLECQAPRCKCGSRCPSKSAASEWLGQSSGARSSADWAVCDRSSGRWAQHQVGSSPWAWPELVRSGSGAAAAAPWEGKEAPWTA